MACAITEASGRSTIAMIPTRYAPRSRAIARSWMSRIAKSTRPVSSSLIESVLAVGAIYIAINETFANWQALWLSFGLLGVAVVLIRTRDAPG